MDARFLVQERTGVETYFQELLQQLVRLDNDEIVLFHGAGVRPNLPPGRWRSVEAVGPSWLWALNGALRRERLDLFYSPVTAFPPLGSLRIVATIHDLSWHHVPESYTAMERLRQKRWTALAVRRAHRVVTVSDASANDLAALFAEARRKTVVVPPGVPEIFHQAVSPQERRRVAGRYRLEGRYLLTVGSFHPRKNLTALVSAYDRFRSQTPERIQLLLAGKGGRESGAVLGRIARSPHRRDILVPGYVPAEDLPALYAGADLFVLMSSYEGFGIPALEAMACRTPVLVSDLPVFREVCGAGALCSAPGDAAAVAAAIAESIRDTPERGKRLEAAARRAREFSWERSAVRLRQVFEDVAREAA